MTADPTPKVLFVCTQMEAGGVQTRAFQMKQSLVSTGIDARIVFLYRKRPTFSVDSSTIVLLSSRPTWPHHFAILAWRILALAFTMRPTAVVGFSYFASPVAALLGIICGARVRVATQTNPSAAQPPIARVLDLVLGTLGTYTANVAASQAVLDSFSGYPRAYRRSLQVIPAAGCAPQ